MELDIYTKRYRRRVREAMLFAGISRDDRVLDVGVGMFGTSSRVLAALGARVISIDKDPKKADHVDKRATFEEGDIVATEFLDWQFKYVTSVLTLHEIAEEEHRPALKEMKRLSKHLLIVEKTPPEDESMAALDMAWRTAMRSVGRVEHVRPPLYWFRRLEELEPDSIRSRFITDRFGMEGAHFRARIEETRAYWGELGVPEAVIEKLDLIPVGEKVEVPPLFVTYATFS